MQLLNELVELARKVITEDGYAWWDSEKLNHEDGCSFSENDSELIAAANPAAILAIAEYVKGLRTQIESEIADFCAGLGSPGEPETPEEMQRQLMERVAAVFDGNHIPDAGKMTGWIKCSERTPEPLDWVIAYDEAGTVKAYICQHTGEWIRDNGDELYQVTHWQPIPEAPDDK